MFSIPCPSCGAKLTSKKAVPAGTRITCPKCQTKFAAGSDGEAEGGASSPAAEPEPAAPSKSSRPSSKELRAVEDRPSRRSRVDDDRPTRRSREEDEDVDRPSRRRRDDDYEDDRPRISRRRDEDFDDERDDYAPRRGKAAPVKGKGLAIAGMVLGIVSIVIAFAGGGPFLCSMCCLGFAPLSWAVSGSGAVIAGVGLVLSIVARHVGYRGTMPVWGIVLSVIAIVLCAAGIILPLVFNVAVAEAIDQGNIPTQNNQPGFNQPNNQPKNNAPKQTMPRDQFRDFVMGMEQNDVAFFYGEPESKRTAGFETTWTYRRLTTNGIGGSVDDSTEVIFRDNKVVRVNFNASTGKRK